MQRLVTIYLGASCSLFLAMRGDDILRHLQHPRIKAMLDVIAFAEGTFDKDGYRKCFGGELFSSFDDHPRRAISVPYRGSYITSTAAGRYQILSKTWDYYIQDRAINGYTGDTTFSPLNQDRVAVQLIIDAGALGALLSAGFKFGAILEKLNAIWASFPGSKYGQPTKEAGSLERFFNNRLSMYGRQTNKVNSV